MEQAFLGEGAALSHLLPPSEGAGAGRGCPALWVQGSSAPKPISRLPSQRPSGSGRLGHDSLGDLGPVLPAGTTGGGCGVSWARRWGLRSHSRVPALDAAAGRAAADPGVSGLEVWARPRGATRLQCSPTEPETPALAQTGTALCDLRPGRAVSWGGARAGPGGQDRAAPRGSVPLKAVGGRAAFRHGVLSGLWDWGSCPGSPRVCRQMGRHVHRAAKGARVERVKRFRGRGFPSQLLGGPGWSTRAH